MLRRDLVEKRQFVAGTVDRKKGIVMAQKVARSFWPCAGCGLKAIAALMRGSRMIAAPP